MAVLTTSRYVEVGTYIGQFFLPGAGALPNEARVPCIVARGDRYLMLRNNQILRSFVYREPLSFTAIAPFMATLEWPSNGNQSSPTRLFTSDGTEVSANKWSFVQVSGQYKRVQILDTEYDPLVSYYLDYQSTSSEVKDIIPDITISRLSATAQVRQIVNVGLLQDQSEFIEYQDFAGTTEVDSPVPDAGNANASSAISAVNSSAATGTGLVDVSASAAYSHAYSRVYRLEVTAAGGTGPSRTATIQWSSAPTSFGSGAQPSNPINPVAAPNVIVLDETNPLSLTNQLLELGVVLDFSFGSANFVVGDLFYVQASGPAAIELDPLLSNTNQFTAVSAIAPSLVGASTGSLSIVSLPTEYTLIDHNLSFRLQVVAVAGSAPNRTATFVWSGYGTTSVSGSFALNEASGPTMTPTLGATGIKVNAAFGATNFVVGDKFDFVVKAPRIFYRGKESVRNVTLSVASVTNPGPNQSVVTGGFVSDTPEGRFGQWAADTSVNQGRFEITDGLRFYVRNGYTSALVSSSPGGATLAAGDKFDVQARFVGGLDFALQRQETQTFSNPAEISTDTNGTITGSLGSKYLTLDHVPTEILYVRAAVGNTAISYQQIPGTPILRITQSNFNVSTGDIQILYRWRGNEPQPGQYYYITAKYLRPESFYNKPILFLTPRDCASFLAPSTIRNDLYIGAQIAWEYAPPGVFVIQVRDQDDDGVYTRDDFKTAINAFAQDRRATDLVVLNNFQSLPDQLSVINAENDPFRLHESITYVGTPIDTPIGSEQETGSLVSLARRTLAVFGNSPAHGTRVLVAPTRATRSITLEDGSSTTVVLDGSFVACALAALVASFADPKETVLLKQLTSFNSMQTYGDQENAQLGGNNIIFFADEGSGIYRIKEDVTVDAFSPDTLNLNQMTQKQFVTRDIRRTINNSIISLVFPSASAGVSTLQSVLVTRLMTIETRGLVGRYQDKNGNVRAISPKEDTFVLRDPSDPTAFNIGYNYFLATTAKRVFGLFTVNLPSGFPR